jgi:H+-translocating NAD(P) transhydrogenase subunit alpha
MNRLFFLLLALLLSASVYAGETAATGLSAIDGFAALFIFMLAAFTGHEIIGKVPVILHTPLMSGSNFVHGIVLVGAMVALGHAESTFGKVLGFIGVLLGAGNAAGGYVVTERMLDMFKSSKKPGAK